MATIKVPMSAAVRQVTLNVVITGVRRAALRTRVGAWLIRLAAMVIGCDVELAIKSDERAHGHDETALRRVLD